MKRIFIYFDLNVFMHIRGKDKALFSDFGT